MTDLPVWYFSFCDPERAEGTQFLGGCYVRADTFETALYKTHEFRCNPGGEVASIGPIDPDLVPVPDGDFNRLLTREEIGA